MEQFSKVILVALVAVIVFGMVLAYLPNALAEWQRAVAEKHLAIGERKLHEAAAEAIEANARQVDAVTNGIYMSYTIIAVTALIVVAVIVRRLLPPSGNEYEREDPYA